MKSFDRVLKNVAGEVGGQGRGERLVRVRGHGLSQYKSTAPSSYRMTCLIYSIQYHVTSPKMSN